MVCNQYWCRPPYQASQDPPKLQDCRLKVSVTNRTRQAPSPLCMRTRRSTIGENPDFRCQTADARETRGQVMRVFQFTVHSSQSETHHRRRYLGVMRKAEGSCPYSLILQIPDSFFGQHP
jgi:hypothetical protein